MKLDINQEKAANYITSHSLIIAGAGSGKTTTLLSKVNYLINYGVKVNEILVISFTNETVNNFKKKCSYNIDVFTFHKLAYDIVGDDYYIVDDDVLKHIINEYLINIPLKLKKKIYHIFSYKIFTNKKYDNFLNTNNSNSIINYIKSIILNIKTNMIDINHIKTNIFNKNDLIILYLIFNIINIYNNYLKEESLIDFDDLIILATNNIKNKKNLIPYKYILVDEYQDISKIRLEFLKSLLKQNKGILTAVGDDYQAIYGFSGSNISLFYNFKNDFKNSEIFYINNTYRCPQEVVDKAGNFIMKNPFQIRKKLISANKKKNTIHKIYCTNKQNTMNKLIKKYININKEILFLSRNNFDINSYLNNNIKFNNSFLIYNNKEYKNIRFLTIHKAKGLEADIVIILNLSNNINGIPCKKKIKILDKIIDNIENYKYAEERRLFYVALTRCKEELYLVIDRNYPSIFIKEI